MEYPFFSIQKQPRMEPLVYDDGKIQITIEPGPKGLATIWDKDILLYVVSLINERIERGMTVDHTVRFAAHDLLRVTGRGTGKRSYDLLLDALHRLRSTNIMTTIEIRRRTRPARVWLDRDMARSRAENIDRP
ncbi:replication initiator protein A [Komagataeibacter nataicola]|nr:replication initiator protein A [Komagataeibacter nataicola]